LRLKALVQSELLRLLKRGNLTKANDNLVAAEMVNIDAEYAALCGAMEPAVI
jgi:hypothetical protein